MNGVLVSPLRRIPTPGGDIFHALKDSDPGYAGFGEAYFTTVNHGAVKGWKRHHVMVSNLIVPCGAVRFVIGPGPGEFEAFDLSASEPGQYQRLTIQPGLWMAFAGLSAGLNLVLNAASIRHDPLEAETCPIDTFPWPWPFPEGP